MKLAKRPAFALAHTMIQTTDDFAVLTERYYYVSNALNSVQITVLWVPEGDGGSVGLAVSANADLLGSMLGRVLRPVGRSKGTSIVTGAMKDIREQLQEELQAPGSQ